MFGSITQVVPNTAKSFEDLTSGFSLRVVGDGRVEKEITDRFESPGLLEEADDRRLKSFVSQYAQIRKLELSKEETQAKLDGAISDALGGHWSLRDFAPEGGSQGKGVLRMQLGLNEPGTGRQTIDLDNWDREPTLKITTTVEKNGWTVTHHIDGFQGASNWTESASFDNASHDEELFHPKGKAV